MSRPESQPVSQPAERLQRDRLTWLVYGQLALYGYFLYGFSPVVPLLREDQGTSAAVSGLHGTALACGALAAGLVGPRVIARWGRGRLLWGSLAGLCAGIVVFCVTPLLPLTLLGALVAGTFGSAIVNTTAAVLADHHGGSGPAAISEANALAAGVGLMSPLVLGLAVALGIGWRAGLLTTLPLALALGLSLGRVRIPAHRADRAEAAPRSTDRHLPARYWWAWGVMVMCISVEFCMTIWSSDILRDRVGLSDGAAATGVTAVVGGMALGRLAGGRLALRRSVDWLLYRAVALTIAGFAVFWVSTLAWLSFAGLFACGLGIALLYPLSIARAIGFADGRTDLATARSSLGAGIAVGGGPFLLGALADAFGTHGAFLLVPLLLVAAALGVRLGGRVSLGGAASS
jgi:predicted MFS family arabinose efflux permease